MRFGRPAIVVLIAVVLQPLAARTSRCSNTWIFERVDTTVTGRVVSAIAMDKLGKPHIAYYDPGLRTLKYASRDSTGWSCEFVDSTGEVLSGNDRNLSLSLDEGDIPHIGYLVRPNPANFNYEFRHAFRDGAGWSFETVYAPGASLTSPTLVRDCNGGFHACVGVVPGPYPKYGHKSGGIWSFTNVGAERGSGFSLVVDCQGDVHMCFQQSYSPYRIVYAVKSGGTWVFDTLSAGIAPSLRLDSQGVPHVSYYIGALKYAVKTAGNWSEMTVDGMTYSGLSSSLALDVADRPHIAYCDGWGYSLDYASQPDGVWVIERLDGFAPQVVAYNTSLALDSEGHAHISYYDGSSRSDLKYATTAVPLSAPDVKLPVPGMTRLLASYPNPFVLGLSVPLSLPYTARARIEIRDPGGRRVRTLVDGVLPSGRRTVYWDGSDWRGARAQPGVYWVVLDLGGTHQAHRVVLLR